MKFKMYTVYDRKLKQFSAPFIQRPDAVDRTVAQIVKQSPIPPVDLVLVQIADWDDETAELYCTDYVKTEISSFVEVDK